MDIAYQDNFYAIVVAVGGGGAYIIKANLDVTSKSWMMKSYPII
jgi:hypothetical protein